MPASAAGRTTTLQLLKRAQLHITVSCHHISSVIIIIHHHHHPYDVYIRCYNKLL